jgi:serine/threonine-protein kinase
MSALDHLRDRLGDRYRIERELGRGGMGAVYLARDLRLDRPVALKVLPAQLATVPALRERFLRETRTAASFSHPNLVPVYAVEEADDLLAYAMGYIEGENLAERVGRAGPLTVRETVKLLQDVAYALAYAHGRGVVHRDIKPDNIMIERATGRALVMDCGIARSIAAPSDTAGLTRVGEIVGTPEYMSPEQAAGDAVDGRSDLYALGLTAYFALTGRVAMAAESTGKVLARQIAEAAPPMRTVRADLPVALTEAIDRCLAKDPAARFPNAESLVEALDAAQLTAPEIPLPVRLFAQEAGTLSMILIFGAIFIVFLLQVADSDDVLLPVVMLFGVLLTRALQTFSDARRLASGGFAPEAVRRGLAAVLAERATRREELRGDVRTARARRRTLIAAVLQLVMAVIMILAAFAFRVPVGDGYRLLRPGMALSLTGVVLLGVSLVLILKSPFRMSVGERLFRLVWLGPIGGGFVRLAGRGTGRRARDGRSEPAGRDGIVRDARHEHMESRAFAVQDDAVAALERRVAALERWRAEGSGTGSASAR